MESRSVSTKMYSEVSNTVSITDESSFISGANTTDHHIAMVRDVVTIQSKIHTYRVCIRHSTVAIVSKLEHYSGWHQQYIVYTELRNIYQARNMSEWACIKSVMETEQEWIKNQP